ncbi:hypothetical protein GMORB2_4017 [Geosmithia morbida]|uniref:Uncharacterized protein n=1 Tax=Geosmithia morbida TaxID=1094350 RepID=A0A9P5D2K5_9HYPO|nr:uncharacterized protein GMORB2_4017 [Geosmithia morbida]KAF4125178.1 hypothetical protein GMORB2_4017 [Geosmithia morbida]
MDRLHNCTVAQSAHRLALSDTRHVPYLDRTLA